MDGRPLRARLCPHPEISPKSDSAQTQSPGEIKRRTLTKKLDIFAGPGEIKRREVSWTLKRAQKRSRAGRWSWAQKVGLLLLQLYLHSCATDIVLVTLLRTAVEPAIAQYSSCYAMARGHCLNILVVLAAVHGLLGLPGRCARSSLHSFAPFSPLSPSLIDHLASVDVKHNVYVPIYQ